MKKFKCRCIPIIVVHSHADTQTTREFQEVTLTNLWNPHEFCTPECQVEADWYCTTKIL